MATIIIFYIVLIGLIAFLQWKVSLLRRGKIEIQTVHRDRHHKIKVIKQIIRYFGHKLKDWLKNGFIRFASWRIRAKARTNYFIETRLPGLYTVLTKRPEVEEHHTKNIFWRGVIEYKYKIQKLKAQILEEESQKIIERENSKESGQEVENEMIKDIIAEAVEETLHEPVEPPQVFHVSDEPKAKRVVKPKKIEVLRPTDTVTPPTNTESKAKKLRNIMKF
ncbi:MAG: hypothetical protein KBB86_02415 [Candidatus Pacebacteria bacterium]|nr:hypothetical protein [Candidatus Paceibacterota bacterium]